MRHYLSRRTLVALFALVSQSGTAQTFTFVPRDTVCSAPLGTEMVFDCTVTNTSTAALTLFFLRTMNNLPPGWESSMCIEVCYPPTVDSIVSPVISPGDTLPFSLHVYSFGTTGTGTVQIVARNSHNPNDRRVLTFHATATPVSVGEDGARPMAFGLKQNYPNPFNSSTVISFQLPAISLVSLRVHDLLGREVETLVNKEMESGNHEVTWDATGMPSGVYLYRLQAGTYSETRKLLLLR